MKIEIRQKDRRALVILGVAVLLFFFADQVVFPTYDFLAGVEETARQKEDELVRYRRAAGRQGIAFDVVNDVEAATDRLRGQLLVPEGGNAPGVRLQRIVETAAEETGIVLRQRNVAERRELGEIGYQEVAMGLSFDAHPSLLAAFLARIRADATHLAVTRLQVTPVDQATEVPEDGMIGRDLQVSMTVVAVSPVPAAGNNAEPAP